jgi:hypothetical protein
MIVNHQDSQEEPKKPSRKTIYRIKKLLALANDKGATEGEAAEASRGAFALLAKWNLSLDSVENSAKDEEEPVETVTAEKSFYAGGDRWAIGLYQKVAELNFCEYFFNNNCYLTNAKGKKVLGVRHNVVGKRSNVIVSHHMADYLLEAVKRLAREDMKAQTFESENQRAHYEYGFRYGCSVRLQQRITAMIEEAKKGVMTDDSSANLPALRNLYEDNRQMLDAHMKENHPNLKVNRRKAKWSEAASQGFR